MTPARQRRVVLTIAGSDPSGGAGIQADLKVFALRGTYGMAVITGHTVQNSRGVLALHAVATPIVRASLAAIVEDVVIRAAKTGMLARAATVTAVVRALAGRSIPLIVDPVLRSSSGMALLEEEGVIRLREQLLPLATLVTPNLDEAEVLLGRHVRTVASMRRAARELVELGAGAALVKGGHLGGTPVDVFWNGRELVELTHPRVNTPHTHGTGCVLSASIVARLAAGQALTRAVTAATIDVERILARASALGAGRGPADPLLAGFRFRAR